MLTQALKQGITEKILKENITHAALDRCMTATFSLLYYEKFKSTENIEIKIDSANALIQMVKRSGNQEIFLYDLGRDFILKAKKNIAALIYIYKTFPAKFSVLESLALSNKFVEYHAMLKTIDLSSVQVDNEREKSHVTSVEWQSGKEYLDTGRNCPACQASPCMCSDPQWHW